MMNDLTEQQLALREHAGELARKKIAPRAAEVDRSEEYPWDNVEALTEAGFMGMTIPEEYGGDCIFVISYSHQLRLNASH